MRWTRMLPLVAVVAVALGACRSPDPLLIISGNGANATLEVEIADTSAERATGLMGREELAPDRGMVFLFDEPTGSGFWMKDTLIPLSIAFWDENRRIVAILDMDPCREDSCPTYVPGVQYVGAVEASQGFFEDKSVEVGDQVELRGGTSS